MTNEYEIEVRGAKIKCKSVKAAVRLLRELGQDRSLGVSPWDLAEFSEFVEKLEARPRKLLATLTQIGEPVDDETLRAVLELDSNKALAGVLSGISKVAISLDITPQRVYRQSTLYEKGKPTRKYWVVPIFKRAAQDADWPSDSDL